MHNELTPGSGPPMHVHFLQDEMLEVLEGELSAEYEDGRRITLKPGESIRFNRGEGHKFWNSGSGTLRCRGWVAPAHSFEWFITENYRILSEASGGRPNGFEMSFLMKHFQSEFDILELPAFVKKVLTPVFYALGKLTGKYKKYKDAPVAVRSA